MELIISKEALLHGLYFAQSIADRKSTNPALANVLLRSDGLDQILCASTDLKTSAVATIKVEVMKEGGICVGAKHLFDIVKSLPGKELHLTRLDNNYVEITAGKAKYKLVGISDRDFPKLQDHREQVFQEVDAAAVVDMINKTIFSVSVDESRPHLCGVFFESDGQTIKMVSTDGHRLSKCERNVGKAPTLEKGIIIPRKGLMEIRKLLESATGTCDIAISPKHFFVRADDIVLSVALIESQFPPYQNVIPKQSEKKVLVPREPLLEMLRRVSLVSSERSSGIRLDLASGRLRLTSDNPDLGEAQEEIEIAYDGAELVAGYNARYFIDVLSELETENAMIGLNGELDPCLVHADGDDNFVGVVMPMRI